MDGGRENCVLTENSPSLGKGERYGKSDAVILLLVSCLGEVLAGVEDIDIDGVLCSSPQSLLPRPLSVSDAPPGEYLHSVSVIS